MADYYVLNIQNLATVYESSLSELAFAHRALGISEKLPFVQHEGEEDVHTQIPELRTLEIYFAQGSEAQAFQEAVRAQYPEVTAQIKVEAERDWLAEWKKSFQPFALIKGHWVVPSWCEPPSEAHHKIWLEPGMAFGTGTHETTRLVAETLNEILADGSAHHSLLDVGTGTGILAVLAHQLGVARVRATEIDTEARRVARETLVRNGCAVKVLEEHQIEQLSETFDVVVANIIDGVLVRIQEALKERVRRGGWLIVSGIITERENDFVEGFHLPSPIIWERRVQKGDWLLFATRL